MEPSIETPAPKPKPIITWFRDRFLAGLFAVLPLILTYWVIGFVYNLVDGPADKVVQQLIKAHGDLPVARYFIDHDGGTIPGAGFVATIALILIVGVIAGNFFGKHLLHGVDEVLLRIPVIKIIYQSLRQAVQAIQQIGGEGKGQQFRQVAYIVLPGSEARAYGFVTGRFVDDEGVSLVTLFIPNAPTPMSGFLLVVPEESVRIASGMSVEQATKMILSLGLILPGSVVAPAQPHPPKN